MLRLLDDPAIVQNFRRYFVVGREMLFQCFLKIFVKPRFGRRRCRGIWPPSKPILDEYPDRDFWPFSPRPAVFPKPLPGPRPTRFFLCVEPFAGCKLLSDSVINLLPDFELWTLDFETNGLRPKTNHSMIFIKCGSFKTAPRMDGVSGRSTI